MTVDPEAIGRELDDIHRQHGMKAVALFVAKLAVRMDARAGERLSAVESRLATLEAAAQPRVRRPAGSAPA